MLKTGDIGLSINLIVVFIGNKKNIIMTFYINDCNVVVAFKSGGLHDDELHRLQQSDI